MYKAIDIAFHLLNIAQRNGDCITNLKLQKLLYYAQAWFMVNNNGELLFDDPIEAWKYGPVIRSVYGKFKKNNSYPIALTEKQIKKLINLPQQVNTFLEEFAVTFYKFSASELVSMTHNEKPWKEAYNNQPYSIIDTKTMYDFYSNLANEK